MRTFALASVLVASILGALALASNAGAQAADPLPSWNDGATRQTIVDFVTATTTKGGADFVDPAERIAVFDNDGTLWGEQPMYVQLAFVLDRVRDLAPEHPEWSGQEPYKTVLAGDLAGLLAGGETKTMKALLELLMATHAGMTSEAFEQIASDWIATARHPETGRLYTAMAYQPMIELIDYLKANDFKVFIISAGGVDFMRPWTERVYGLPPENVFGSSIKLKYEMKDGEPVLMRQPEIDFVDNQAGKPVGIQKFIGQRPIVAFGNSDDDFEMVEWTTSGPGLRLGGFVHHDDAEREYAYDRDSRIGKLARGLDEAPTRGWTIISIKDDWKVIYPE